MILYVKEFADCLSIEKIREWIKNEIPICVYNGENTSFDDYVLVSKNDEKTGVIGEATILEYEDLFERVSNSLLEELKYNYNYYYLNCAIQEGKKSTIDTIITGSSYGLHGIDRSQLKTAVNLSLLSQDLYFSVKGIEEVCEANPNIKNIVLCCSYYYFYSDLSKTQCESELGRVSKVYYPLFHDLHNAIYLPPKYYNKLPASKIIDVEKMMQFYAFTEYEKCYFYEQRPTYKFAVKEWDDKEKNWQQLSEEERTLAGEKRAVNHNGNINYIKTYQENQMIMEKLSQYCEERQINLIVLVTPISKYYRAASLPEFKEDFYHVLDSVSGAVHVIDKYDDESFEIADFNDMDHLNEFGAKKLTALLLDEIERINE